MHVISACKITHVLNCTLEITGPKQISKLLKGFKRLPLVDKNNENILVLLKNGLLFVDEVLILIIFKRDEKTHATTDDHDLATDQLYFHDIILFVVYCWTACAV